MRNLVTFTFLLAFLAVPIVAVGQGSATGAKVASKATQDTMAQSPAPKGREKKMTGKLVNLDCYAAEDLTAKAIDECSQSSKSARSLAILSGGKLYLLVTNDTSINLTEKVGQFAGKSFWAVGTPKTVAGVSVLVLRGAGGELAR
jgi:hypothetical protein